MALSLLMLIVLCCTVIVVKLYSRHIDAFSRPRLELKTLGAFRVGGPMGWEPVTEPVVGVEGLRTLGHFDEPARYGRRLSFYQMRSRTPITPATAVAGVLGRLKAKIIVGRKPHLFRTTTLFGIAVEAIGENEGGFPKKHLLAVLTLDGRRYLVIDLSGRGRPTRYDAPLLERITGSVQSLRYHVVESPVVFNHDVAMQLPSWLLAFEPARQGTGHYLVIPAKGVTVKALLGAKDDESQEEVVEEVVIEKEGSRSNGGGDDIKKEGEEEKEPEDGNDQGRDLFALIDAVAFDLSKPLVGAEGIPEDSTMPKELKERLLSDRLNPSARLVLGMMLRYWQLTGALPEAEGFFPLGDRNGFVLATPTGTEVLSGRTGLDDTLGKGLVLHRWLYAFRLDKNRAIMLDLLAESDATELVKLSAGQLLLGLYDVNDPPTEVDAEGESVGGEGESGAGGSGGPGANPE